MFQELLCEVVLLGLAVWRVSHALTYEDGPFGVFEKLRKLSGAYRAEKLSGIAWLLVQPLTCTNCMILVAGSGAAFLVKHGWLLTAVAWLAISAVATAIDMVVNPPE